MEIEQNKESRGVVRVLHRRLKTKKKQSADDNQQKLE